MARIITFSKTFPSYHPKKGQPTFFVEKILNGVAEKSSNGIVDLNILSDEIKNIVNDFALLCGSDDIKHHTIRAGNRWKAGDYFSPRVWSGKPYRSPMITIAPDIKIEKVWNIWHDGNGWWINGDSFYAIERLSNNDGLSLPNFLDWFKIHPKKKKQTFIGQIICWNKNIEY